MSDSVYVLNPRRRRRRKTAKRATAKKATRRRRRRTFAANPAPKKRRRSARRTRRTRGYRRNPGRARAAGAALTSPLPGLPKLGTIDVGFALVAGGGLVGHGMLTNLAAQYVPVDKLKSGAGKFGLGVGVALIGSIAAHKFLPKKLALPLSIGMGTGVVVQVYQQFIAPKFPQLPVSGIENIETLQGIQENYNLSGVDDVAVGSSQFSDRW